MKNREKYICKYCSYESLKWLGFCSSCNHWDSFIIKSVNETFISNIDKLKLKKYDEIEDQDIKRIKSNIKEWDRVIGDGIIPGEFIILTGDPGIGKSTLLLQVAHEIAKDNKIIYFSTEESLSQIKIRAKRTKCYTNSLIFSDITDIDNIISISIKENPKIIIVDSIQNSIIESNSTNNINNLKDAAFKLLKFAKQYSIAIIITGHITKDGIIAGPKLLEHMADAVLYLQGEDKWQIRILRSTKNRFGNTDEIGLFQIYENGIQEVSNINKELIKDISYTPGSVLVSFIEGTRPILLEMQSLVVHSKYTIPQRIISGIDHTQVTLITAIIEKYLNIKLSCYDIFFKISNNFKIKSDSADLSIALSLLSSYFQKPLLEHSLAIGIISLTGQIKPINSIAIHLSEAEKFNINTIVTSDKQKIDNKKYNQIKLHSIKDLLMFFE